MLSQVFSKVSNDDILYSLWGVKSGNENESLGSTLKDEYQLDAYFSYCQKQFTRVKHPALPGQVLQLIEQLRNTKSVSRNEVKATFAQAVKANSRDFGLSVSDEGDEGSVKQDLSTLEVLCNETSLDYVVDVAASIILGVHVTHNLNSIEPGRSKIQWENGETLEDFVAKAFPQVGPESNESLTPLNPNKFRAAYFEGHAEIQIQWTEHLYDHLQLSTSESSKMLKVFQLPCMLEAALEVTKQAGPDLTSTGVRYSQDFLLETLTLPRT
ncbi:hypothetical protein F5Y16DRAFT_28590 [Xylariaceae sp. FL0255]|nr:hypothetical protein F5Y16DRAFT_28590 [Xylariaceae sp. FL0255]